MRALHCSIVRGGQQKHERRIPIDRDFVERICHLVVEPHAHWGPIGQVFTYRICRIRIRTARQKTRPGSRDIVGDAGTMVRMKKRVCSYVCNPGDSEAIASE